jgi:hypothetical protein
VVTTDTTWANRLNGALDRISAMTNDRNDALDAITAFLRDHPEHEDDLRLTTARLALL